MPSSLLWKKQAFYIPYNDYFLTVSSRNTICNPRSILVTVNVTPVSETITSVTMIKRMNILKMISN